MTAEEANAVLAKHGLKFGGFAFRAIPAEFKPEVREACNVIAQAEARLAEERVAAARAAERARRKAPPPHTARRPEDVEPRGDRK